MTDLVVTRLTFLETVELWHEFAESMGKDALRVAYGPRWPRLPFDNELVYSFKVPTCGGEGEIVGWASLIPDVFGQVTYHSHGIFPQYQKLKLTKPLTDLSKALGFSETNCVALCAHILDTNTEYQAWFRENYEKRGWKPAGRVTLPEGYDVYVILRKDWAQS
jgi:hypothetical protein